MQFKPLLYFFSDSFLFSIAYFSSHCYNVTRPADCVTAQYEKGVWGLVHSQPTKPIYTKTKSSKKIPRERVRADQLWPNSAALAQKLPETVLFVPFVIVGGRCIPLAFPVWNISTYCLSPFTCVFVWGCLWGSDTSLRGISTRYRVEWSGIHYPCHARGFFEKDSVVDRRWWWWRFFLC